MKRIMKKVTAILMAMVMVMSCMVVNGTTAEAVEYTVNPAEYGIEYLLSNYQVYVKEDLTTTQGGHQVGSLIVGKDATLANSFGDASIASSYLNNIKAFLSVNPFYSSVFSKPEYAGCENSRVYYTTKADNIYLNDNPKTFVQVDSYINFTNAFDSIQTQADSKASAGTPATMEGDYIVLDMSAGVRHTYTITAAQLKAAKAIRLKGTDGKSDVFRDLNNPLVISFTGCGDNDISFYFDNEGTVDEYSIGMQLDKNADPSVDEYTSLNNEYAFKMWADSQEGGQVNALGTRVIYNFPDATGNITTQYLAGHLVAPNANIIVNGGNYEGGIIANSATIHAEGHFYPYYEIGKATSDLPKSPSLTGKDFLITVQQAQNATEDTVIDLSEGLHYSDVGAEGKSENVAVDNLSDLTSVTEPGTVTITLKDGTDETVKAVPVDVVATVVDEKASNTQWDGTKNAVYQLGANDFEMSIAQVEAYLANSSGTAETTLVKTLANATAIKDGTVDDISNINIQDASQLRAEKGTYNVTFSYNNNQVTVQVTVKDDGPTDDETNKTTIPGVNLTANNFTVKGGSATLTPTTFAAEDKADVVAKNLDGSSRNDITIDASDLAALNDKIKNAKAGDYPVKVYSGGETTTVTVTVDTQHPYISADDFIVSVEEAGKTDAGSIKDLADAKKIHNAEDTTGDSSDVTVDANDAADLKAQTEPGVVDITITDTSADADKALDRVVIATVVDETAETDDTATNELKIGANHFNISKEQAQAVVNGNVGSDDMITTLANAVATSNGDAVDPSEIDVDCSNIKAEKGTYDVTFTYKEGTDRVSVTVQATVKDNGPTDGQADPTKVPSINLTANDFAVEGGSGEIDAATFKKDEYAKVEANYNEGPSIPDNDVTVNAADLATLNEKIQANIPGKYDVEVSINGVSTIVTVTVTEKYPKLDANDFIISVEDAKKAEADDVKDLADLDRYTTPDEETAGTSKDDDKVTVPDFSDLTGVEEPGTVDVTFKDTNADPADDKEVTATVVDETTTATVDGKEIVIGANNYYISMAQAEAVVKALADASAKPNKAATDAMNKILANAVATEAGEEVDRDDIVVDASKIQAADGAYDVTFTYNGVSVTVKATVKDAGSTDHYDDPTAVPDVNLTANDFEVQGGSAALDADDFKDLADVVAKNNDGSTRTDVTVDADELAALNEKITGSQAGKYDVDVECDGVITTVTVTVVVNEEYPKVDANDFIISVEDAKDATPGDVKDLSDANRYTTPDEETSGTPNGNDKVTVPDVDDLKNMDEPGSVDLTVKDNNDNPADDVTVTATVVDKTTTNPDVDGAEVVIGANHYNLSVEQAQAIVDALANPTGTPSKEATDAMNKVLANAVATDDGEAVDPEDIAVDASKIKAENGTYDVTFTYTKEGSNEPVSVTVQATVKDAGGNDGEDDQTDVPDVNVTGNDFVVKVGTTPEITADDFMNAPGMADIDANYNDGSSVPSDKITVDPDDLKELNDAIKNGETGPVDVDVTADGVTTTITVTVTDDKTADDTNKEVIAANDFEIDITEYDTVVPSKDELIERAEALAYDETTRGDVEIVSATVVDPVKEAGEYDVVFKTAAGTEVTVTMTITAEYPKVDANDFIISVDDAKNATPGDVKDLSDANRYTTPDEETSGTPNGNDKVTVPDVDGLNDMDEPGSVDLTVKDNNDNPADDVTVTATVVDKTTTNPDVDGAEVVIGANHYNLSVEQAQAIVDALANPAGTPSKEATDAMNKVLANAVATDDGEAVESEDIAVDASKIKAENGTYDVTFTYTKEGSNEPVSVTVQATVKDAGGNDGEDDQTDVPDVNVTGNDFVVKVGTTPEITADDFMNAPGMADIDANYNDGSSVPSDKITVDPDDLKELNDAIKNGETGPVDVDVTADGVTTTITVTVTDDKTADDTNKEVIAANDFEIDITEYDTVVPSKDELIERAEALAYDETTRGDVEIVSATVVDPVKEAGEYDVVFKTAAGTEVTVTMTIKEIPAGYPKVDANDFIISVDDAKDATPDDVKDLSDANRYTTPEEETSGTPNGNGKVTVPDVDDLKNMDEPGSVDLTVKDTNDNPADDVTVKATVVDETTTNPDVDGVEVVIGANNYNLSVEQAQAIVDALANPTGTPSKEAADAMNKLLANAVATDDGEAVPREDITVDASKVKPEKGSYDVTFTYTKAGSNEPVSVTVKATVKDAGTTDKADDPTNVPNVNLTANDFTVDAGSGSITEEDFKKPIYAKAEANNQDGSSIPSSKIDVDDADLKELNDKIAEGKATTVDVKVTVKDPATGGDVEAVVTVTIKAKDDAPTKGDDIQGVDQIYEISNPKNVPQDLADGRTVATVNVNGKDIPASAFTVNDGKMEINKSVFKDMKEGTYPVVITYTDGSKHTFNVKVIPYDDSTVVKKVPTFHMQKDLGVGKTFKLNLVGMNKYAVKKFKSNNKRIATINKNGVIKGKKKGKCKITATVIQNGSYYTVKIDLHVKKSMKMYNLKKAALQKKQGILPEFNVYKRVVKGRKTKLKFTNVEKDAKITFKSSNKKVATVSKKGVIKGKKKGFTVVTAKIQQNGFTYYTKLIVRVDDGTKNKQLKKYLK